MVDAPTPCLNDSGKWHLSTNVVKYKLWIISKKTAYEGTHVDFLMATQESITYIEHLDFFVVILVATYIFEMFLIIICWCDLKPWGK